MLRLHGNFKLRVMPEMGMAGMTVCTGMAGPRPGEPGVPWWERWRAFADFTGVATAAAWDLAPEPVLARGAPDTVERAMADTLTAYQHAACRRRVERLRDPRPDQISAVLTPEAEWLAAPRQPTPPN